MALNVEHLLRTADTLEQALLAIENQAKRSDVLFDLYRNAAIKSFELSLETAGKLLRKALKLMAAAPARWCCARRADAGCGDCIQFKISWF